MPTDNSPSALLGQFRDLLETRVKVDIAEAIRVHPHLTGDEATKAYQNLTSGDTVDRMVKDLAFDETQAAVNRGEVPPAALILLAGFRSNPVGEC